MVKIQYITSTADCRLRFAPPKLPAATSAIRGTSMKSGKICTRTSVAVLSQDISKE